MFSVDMRANLPLRPGRLRSHKGGTVEAYRLFWVGTLKIKPGKYAEAQKFWREKGLPDILADPWTKSVKCYAVQFGLGGEYAIEVWQESKTMRPSIEWTGASSTIPRRRGSLGSCGKRRVTILSGAPPG